MLGLHQSSVLLTPHQVGVAGGVTMTGDWPVTAALHTYQAGLWTLISSSSSFLTHHIHKTWFISCFVNLLSCNVFKCINSGTINVASDSSSFFSSLAQCKVHTYFLRTNIGKGWPDWHWLQEPSISISKNYCFTKLIQHTKKMWKSGCLSRVDPRSLSTLHALKWIVYIHAK